MQLLRIAAASIAKAAITTGEMAGITATEAQIPNARASAEKQSPLSLAHAVKQAAPRREFARALRRKEDEPRVIYEANSAIRFISLIVQKLAQPEPHQCVEANPGMPDIWIETMMGSVASDKIVAEN
jgi:hypothetical protein